ncbi:hypothetical protein TSH7_01320 [Azospirillum sp. TSH7]|uniref:hypothetical protein n=1 Tax=unclassified Azospirillum TaxID=2630922 RepID=UPI000D62223A|nr:MULTISPECIES: hypothetical protein [unclassified Azospirillum]PWC69112.1 hypothetical protein TSH7_01320 [Azospirillum sp. TSH7]PWC71396.1 hypothetical protein TSH20_03755 [Azospirillum sp. TSH20]
MKRVQVIVEVDADDKVYIGDINGAIGAALEAAGSVDVRGGQVFMRTARVLNRAVAEAARRRYDDK